MNTLSITTDELTGICNALGYPANNVNPDALFHPENTQAVMSVVHQKMGIRFAITKENQQEIKEVSEKHSKIVIITNHPTHFNIALIQMALAECLSGGNKVYEKVQELGQISTTLVGPRVFAEEVVRYIGSALSHLLLTIPRDKIENLLNEGVKNELVKKISSTFKNQKKQLLELKKGIVYIAPTGTTDKYQLIKDQKQYIYPADTNILPALSLIDEFVNKGYQPIIILTKEDFETQSIQPIVFEFKELTQGKWSEMRNKNEIMPTFAEMTGGIVMNKSEIIQGTANGSLKVQNVSPLLEKMKSSFL